MKFNLQLTKEEHSLLKQESQRLKKPMTRILVEYIAQLKKPTVPIPISIK